MARVSSCALAAMLVAVSGPVASAADLDSAIGLIVAGEVEKPPAYKFLTFPMLGRFRAAMKRLSGRVRLAS
jgi:hypothetical protein